MARRKLKPEQPAEAEQPMPPEEATKDELSEAEVMYSEYVHGTPINDIAAKRHMRAQEALELVTAVEQNRHK